MLDYAKIGEFEKHWVISVYQDLEKVEAAIWGIFHVIITLTRGP